MTSIRKNPVKNKKLLTDFIRQVRSFSDTPSLIQLIAADAGHLMLCREIVNISSQRNQEFFTSLKAVCRKQGLDFQWLQEKLIPAARALGLTLSSKAQLDYYNLLGISPLANTLEIKKAFRKKAYKVHPDTSADGHHHNEKFVELNTAYQTLSDPLLRKHYDLSRQHLERWHERPMQIPKAFRMRRALFVFQLVGLLVILMLAMFVFDFLFLENNSPDGFNPFKLNPPPVSQSLLATQVVMFT